jgi:phosphoribosylaminoimidazole (AIR) synthetase
MGIGIILVVAPKKLPAASKALRAARMPNKLIGEICKGRGAVIFD